MTDTASASVEMASSSNYRDDVEDEDDYYVPYGARSEWSDVDPLPHVPSTHNILVIDYSPRFADCFNYFRAVLMTGEKSPRVLALTKDAIELNAANYTVWQYRRDVLQALGIPGKITEHGINAEFEKEFFFSLESIEENQKNYQVWHHRKILTQWAAGGNEETDKVEIECPEARQLLFTQELELTVRLLNKDAKNYHAWQYRQWILSAFNAFEDELQFLDTLLVEDVRNNSAWNQRYFVITRMGTLTEDFVKGEIAYTWTHILKAPSNESPWSYLQGLFRLIPEVTLANADDVIGLCEDLLSQKVKTPAMLGFMLTVYEQRLKAGTAKPGTYQNAIELCDILALTLDKIRCSYWNHIKRQLETKFGE